MSKIVEEEQVVLNEGWALLPSAHKWHYISRGWSLCGRWVLGSLDLKQGNDYSSLNCSRCKGMLIDLRGKREMEGWE
tara:strand:+ start:5648 stop:5878 length:231 start_codon:yes stop_codon:yes gene_type:complete